MIPAEAATAATDGRVALPGGYFAERGDHPERWIIIGPDGSTCGLLTLSARDLDAIAPSIEGGLPSTPSAKWRAEGKPDPHGDRYACERAKLGLGSMTDDQLANAVFMHGGDRLNLAAIQRGEPSPIALLTAAKDRIRWLSRQLEAAQAAALTPSTGGGVPAVSGIYMASKAVHGPRWRKLREAGWPIISTWIDEAEAGRTTDWVDLWDRCAGEPARAAVTVLYAEQGEELKGALAEVGAALSHGRKVIVVGPVDHTWTKHRNVHRAADLTEARELWMPWLATLRAAAPAPRTDPDGLTRIQRLNREKADLIALVARAQDPDGPGIMRGDVEGAFHRIEQAVEACGEAGAPDGGGVAEVERLRAIIARLTGEIVPSTAAERFSQYAIEIAVHDWPSTVVVQDVERRAKEIEFEILNMFAYEARPYLDRAVEAEAELEALRSAPRDGVPALAEPRAPAAPGAGVDLAGVSDRGQAVHAFAREYEHRDPDHTPTDAERAMLEDFGNALLESLDTAGAGRDGGAGEGIELTRMEWRPISSFDRDYTISGVPGLNLAWDDDTDLPVALVWCDTSGAPTDWADLPNGPLSTLAGRGGRTDVPEELRKLSDAATPGPWRVDRYNNVATYRLGIHEQRTTVEVVRLQPFDLDSEKVGSEEDIDLIAAAVNDLRARIATEDRARGADGREGE